MPDNTRKVKMSLTKFLACVHLLFLTACTSTKNETTNVTKENKITNTKLETRFEQNFEMNLKITTFEDNSQIATILSIFLKDEDFPMKLTTADWTVTVEQKSLNAFKTGDNIQLRKTELFMHDDEFAHAFNTPDKKEICQQDEFKMLAKIDSPMERIGVTTTKNQGQKKPWFAIGNVICVRILKGL